MYGSAWYGPERSSHILLAEDAQLDSRGLLQLGELLVERLRLAGREEPLQVDHVCLLLWKQLWFIHALRPSIRWGGDGGESGGGGGERGAA